MEDQEGIKFMKKILALIAVIMMCAVSACARKESLAQAAETSTPVVSGAKETAAPSQEGDQIKHKVMAFDLEGLGDDGSKKWDVKGQSAEAVTENQVKLNNITASSYGKDAQATITADTGLYDKAKNNVRLEQNVKAVIENNGKGAESFIDLQPQSKTNSSSTPPAHGSDKLKKAKTTITCDAEVEFSYEKNEGYFNKNVHVVNDDGTIDADRITIYLDPATKTVKTIVAEGNVKIMRGENITYSDKATYMALEKKIVLSGQPKLVIYQEGDEQMDFLGASKK